MLEILLLIFLSKKIAASAEEKGYGGVLFILLFLGCWIGGEIFGIILGTILFHSAIEAWGLGVGLALAGTIFSFVVVAVLPNNNEDRFDSLGRHRIRGGKRRKRRRPIEDVDDSYREKFQPRRRQEETDDLEIIEEDELEIIEEEEVKKPLPRKPLPQPPARKPTANSDNARIQKPEQKLPPRPPLRKPGPPKDGPRPPAR